MDETHCCDTSWSSWLPIGQHSKATSRECGCKPSVILRPCRESTHYNTPTEIKTFHLTCCLCSAFWHVVGSKLENTRTCFQWDQSSNTTPLLTRESWICAWRREDLSSRRTKIPENKIQLWSGPYQRYVVPEASRVAPWQLWLCGPLKYQIHSFQGSVARSPCCWQTWPCISSSVSL